VRETVPAALAQVVADMVVRPHPKDRLVADSRQADPGAGTLGDLVRVVADIAVDSCGVTSLA
jgi:hypothetical protein